MFAREPLKKNENITRKPIINEIYFPIDFVFVTVNAMIPNKGANCHIHVTGKSRELIIPFVFGIIKPPENPSSDRPTVNTLNNR